MTLPGVVPAAVDLIMVSSNGWAENRSRLSRNGGASADYSGGRVMVYHLPSGPYFQQLQCLLGGTVGGGFGPRRDRGRYVRRP